MGKTSQKTVAKRQQQHVIFTCSTTNQLFTLFSTCSKNKSCQKITAKKIQTGKPLEEDIVI